MRDFRREGTQGTPTGADGDIKANRQNGKAEDMMNILKDTTVHSASLSMRCFGRSLKAMNGMRVFIIFCCVFILGMAVHSNAQNVANWSPGADSSSGRVSEAGLKDAASVDEVLKMIEPAFVPDLQQMPSGRYTLGPNDVIQIMVMRHPEVSGEYMINQEGRIQYEFVGDIYISGLTKEEAADVLVEALSEYIISPEVVVKITQYNSKIVYVVGEVFNPGKIYMRGDTITVREALLQAGLPRLSGVTRKSRLISPSEEGRPRPKMVDVYALLYEGDLRQNEVMEPGDVLYVPPTFLTRVMRVISPVAAPIGQAAGARVGAQTLGTGPNQ